jgi:hypothetical protein
MSKEIKFAWTVMRKIHRLKLGRGGAVTLNWVF